MNLYSLWSPTWEAVWCEWCKDINRNSGLKSNGGKKMKITWVYNYHKGHPIPMVEGRYAFGSTLQGIMSAGEELSWSPKSFKLGLCLQALVSTRPDVPWGQPRVLSGSNQNSSKGCFCRCYFLKCLFTTVWQHWIPDFSSPTSEPG